MKRIGWGLVLLLASWSPAHGLEYVLKIEPSVAGVSIWVDDVAVGSTNDRGLVVVDAEPGRHTVGANFRGSFVSREMDFDSELNFLLLDLSNVVPAAGDDASSGPDTPVGSPADTSTESRRIEYLVQTNVLGAAVHVDGHRQTTTDGSGRARIELVEGREHRIRITKSGYEDFETETVASEIGNYIEAELVREPRPARSSEPFWKPGTIQGEDSAESHDLAPGEDQEPGRQSPPPRVKVEGDDSSDAREVRPTPGDPVPPTPSDQEPAAGTPVWLYGVLLIGILGLIALLGLVVHGASSEEGLAGMGPRLLQLLGRARGQEKDQGHATHSDSPEWTAPNPQPTPRMPSIGAEYRVTGLLRRGGQAEIYLAESLGGGARYAVKLPLTTEEVDEESLEEFFEEATQSRRLLNPHIITVYKAGMDAMTDRPYYIMDYFEGPSLREFLRHQAPLPEVEAIEQVVLPILHGLNYAHSRTPEVIHKDLKPENVLVRGNQDGHIVDLKLIDFGLSFMRDRGAFPGTPPYVAPELFEGEEATPASDLFSLGVMTLEVLTGRPPFFADSVRETRAKILEGEYDVEGLSSPLAAIVDKLLAVKRAERYQTAEDVILDCRDTLFSFR